MHRRGSYCLCLSLTAIALLIVAGDGRQLARRWYSGVYQNVTWECTQPGPMCSSCNEVSICVLNEHEDGTTFYQQLQVDTCEADEGCNHLTARCSQRVGECYGGIKFRCHNEGVFPDPYDCNVYYICGTPPKSLEPVVEYDYVKQYFCPWGSAFNAETEKCDLPDDDEICVRRPVPPCEKFLQTGSLEANPNIYYSCVNVSGKGLQPKLFRCASSETLDADNFVCRSKQETSTSSTESVATITSTVVTGATTTISTSTITNAASPTTIEPTTTANTEPTTTATTIQPSTTTTTTTEPTTTTTTTKPTTTTTTEPTTTTTTTEPTTTTTTTTEPTTTTTTTKPTTTTTTTTEPTTTTTTTEPTTTTTTTTEPTTTTTTTEPTTTTTTTTEPTTTTTTAEPTTTSTTTTEPTTTVEPTTITTTTTEPTTTTLVSTTTGEMQCTSVSQTFPDPKDCRRYYRCAKIGEKPINDLCIFGLGHYDRETKGCVMGSC